MSRLKDKTVLITGASAGIGAACACKFAETGARLILAARRRDRLEEVSTDLNVDVHLMELDVTDRSAVEAAIDGLPESFREIDLLVNNAGLGRGVDKLHEGNIDGWEEMIDTNVKGLLYLSRTVIPGMVARGRGHVINIGSIAGHLVYPGGSVYCATKHAVDALTKGMQIDLVDTPIRVSTVDPGLVETEFSRVRFYGDTERAAKTYQGFQPLIGEDVAEAVVWIADRPPHVQIGELIILPTAQTSTMHLHKEG
ncbi:MAG: SDR family oxidoreductase [candidate division Zixibacteria bacterium]|nr:SDR family oxidoreductase [candidate division Zixibacteria bacterium]MDH3937741.1 SDR family oxidoreductase [candidate division Zixibacteria bacterium]MDH4033081.1 SDR family oxidoreductase [candidate division Zixibacteria bacterium]